MIEPLHFCWWSHEKQTLLQLNGGCFESAGTSLSVLWDALNTGQQWFSREYGEVHCGQSDGVFAVAPVEVVLAEAQPGGLTTRLGDTAVHEFFLSEDLRQKLNLSGEEEHFAPNNLSLVDCTFRLHDDCFAIVQPVDDARLLCLLHSTLKLHSYYHSKEINWVPVLKLLAELLVTVGEVALISDTEAGVMFVDHPNQSFARRLGKSVKPYFARIEVTDEQASLRLLKGSTSAQH